MSRRILTACTPWSASSKRLWWQSHRWIRTCHRSSRTKQKSPSTRCRISEARLAKISTCLKQRPLRSSRSLKTTYIRKGLVEDSWWSRSSNIITVWTSRDRILRSCFRKTRISGRSTCVRLSKELAKLKIRSGLLWRGSRLISKPSLHRMRWLLSWVARLLNYVRCHSGVFRMWLRKTLTSPGLAERMLTWFSLLRVSDSGSKIPILFACEASSSSMRIKSVHRDSQLVIWPRSASLSKLVWSKKRDSFKLAAERLNEIQSKALLSSTATVNSFSIWITIDARLASLFLLHSLSQTRRSLEDTALAIVRSSSLALDSLFSNARTDMGHYKHTKLVNTRFKLMCQSSLLISS